MSSFNQRVVVSVLLCACSLTSSVFAAKKGGISDQSTRVVTTLKVQQIGKGLSTIGNIADSSDAGETTTSDTTTSSDAATTTRTCNFSGFAQNDLVNNAYSGGTSANGVSQINNAMTFANTKVLNTYYGSNEPDAGIVFSPSGRIVASLVNFSANQISFSYTSSVALTVSEFSSTDGTGTPINSYTAASNLPYGPYNVWSTFGTPLSANTKSIAISGTFDKWGIDNMVLTSASVTASAQRLAIFYNKNWVSDDGEAEDAISALTNLGFNVTTFTGYDAAAFTQQFADKRTIVFPELEYGSPVSSGSSAAIAIQNGVLAGGSVLTLDTAESFSVNFLSSISGWNISKGGSPSVNLNTAAVAGTVFSTCPLSIGSLDGDDVTSRGWPTGTLFVYGSSSAATVSVANLGLGRIGYMTFGSENSPSTRWHAVLGKMVEYLSQPSLSPNITSVSPTNGSQFGGTTITLNGINFTGATSVTVGGVATTNLVVVSATKITAVTPFSSTSGARDVTVTTPNGSFTASASFTYIAAVSVLALTNDAGACNHAGGKVNVDATLSGVISPIDSGQIYISWNPANLRLDSITAGDAPFDQLPLHTINQSAGTALLVTSIALGQTPVSVISKVVARMHYTVLGGTCNGSGTDVQFFPDGTLPTEFTDGFGSKLVPALVASSGFKVDDTSPVFSNVPAAVSVNADAGEGAFARVSLIAPTATDACGAVTQASSRSDGAAMNAMYAVGTTTVTWSATDLCGNTSTATTSVTVKPYNTARFQVQYVGVNGGAATRSFVTTMRGPQISLPSTVNGVSIANGAGEFFVTNAPIDNYFCATVEDAASTLRRRVSVTDAGTEWLVVVTLVSGDVINDEVIDVLDWGAYVVLNANADLNMDRSINGNDGAMIINNFGQRGDTACGSSFTDSPEPVTSISIAELVDRGMADLVAADLNNDGWLDMADVELSLR